MRRRRTLAPFMAARPPGWSGFVPRAGGVVHEPTNVLANTYAGMTWLVGWDAAFSTLSQDTAGATPVTAAGQLVGRATDLSGTDHLVRLVNDTLRPTYQTGPARLEFDGTDGMATAGNVALGAPTSLTIVLVGDLPAEDASLQTIFGTEEGTGLDAPNGAFVLRRQNTTANRIEVIARQSLSSALVQTTNVDGVTATRAVHVVTLLNATTTVTINWRQGSSYSPLTTSVAFTNRSGGGAFADRRVRVGSRLDGTVAMTGGLLFAAIASGEPTSAGHAALYADLAAGRL